MSLYIKGTIEYAGDTFHYEAEGDVNKNIDIDCIELLVGGEYYPVQEFASEGLMEAVRTHAIEESGVDWEALIYA